MKFFDAFSGYGGFHLGIERAYDKLGSEKTRDQRLGNSVGPGTNDNGQGSRVESQRSVCIGYSEIDKYASAVYKYHFGGKNYGDIKSINASELPDFDLLCGGFPCQAFSIAGKRLGFAETRGTLIYEVFRILKEKQPRFCLLENVKGLLSHDSGRTFKTIISSLAELGYSVEWQVLNAKNFGVPQNRERVFIIGHLGGFGGRQVFPIRENSNENTTLGQSTETAVARTFTAGAHSGGNHSGMTIIKKTQKLSDAMRIRDTEGASVTLKGLGGGLGAKTGLYDMGDMKIRRLTPTECERLMGLPDGWTKYGDFDGEIKEISDTQRYKLCGNGVVVNVVEAIISQLKERQ